MKNTKDSDDSQEITVVRRVKHFGGKHTTTYYSDGSTCNTYEDGYKSNSESITKTFSDTAMNTATTATTKPAKVSKTKASKSKKASTKKPTKRVDTDTAVPATVTSPAKVSRADVKAAVENFLKNPPDKPLTLAQVYDTIGFAHRQVYMMVREHGVPAGKSDAPGKGRKETLFTFRKTA